MDGTAAPRPLLAGVLLSLLAACSTMRQTDPPQTATEQLLVSHAVERAVERLHPACPKTGTVFLDTQYYDTDNGMVLAKYTIGAVRDRLLRLGCHLAEDRKSADVVIEMRTAAQSIDQSSTLLGIPSIPIPVPLSGGAVSTPEVAFFKVERLTGVSKIALTVTDRNGALVSSTGPISAESHRKHYVILLLVSYSTNDIYPGDQETPPPAVNAAPSAAAAVPPAALQRARPAPLAAPAEPENHALPGLPQ